MNQGGEGTLNLSAFLAFPSDEELSGRRMTLSRKRQVI